MSDKVQVQKNSSAPSQMAPSPQFQERPFTDERYQTVANVGAITADSSPQPNIARASFNLLNMPIFAPSSGTNVQEGNIQRQKEEKQGNFQLKEESSNATSVEEEKDENQDVQLKEESDNSLPLAEEKDENQDVQLKEESDNALPVAEEKNENQDVQLKEESDNALPVAEEKDENQDVQLKEEESNNSYSEETLQEDTELKPIQTKLTVGKPGDKYEQEADNMAAKVMAMPDSAVGESIQRQTDDEKKEIQTSPLANFITPLVQRSPERRSNRKATRTSTLNSTSGTVDPRSRTRGSTKRTTELNELGVQPPRRNLKQQPYKQDINGQELWNGIDRLLWGNDFEENYWQNVPHQLNPQRNNRKEYECIVGANNQTQYLPRSGDAQPGEDIATIGHKTQWRSHILNNANGNTFTVENDGTQIRAISRNEAETWYRDLNNLRPEGQSYNSQKARPYTSDPLHQEYEESNNSSSVETPQENIALKSIQTKLTVGKPGDKYEQEADSMAVKVMTMPDSAVQQPIQRQTNEEKEQVQRQPLANSITPVVQRSPNGNSQASGNIESSLSSSKGGGSSLPDDVRNFMEPRFGADLSGVRVHTDSTAVQMNKELGAQAFAHGSDIYFGAGKSPGKNELTAHELTHTIQQGGAVRTKSVTPQDKKENKLQAKADAIQLTALEPKIQRKENPQAQPAAAKVAAPAPQNATASPAAKSEKGEPANTIEKPIAGGAAGAPSAPAGNSGGGGAGASSGGAAGAGAGGGGGNSPGSAQSDPGFKAVVNSTKTVATQEKNHPPAGTKSAEAQAAAVSPANEVESKAQDKQVQEMSQQQPGQFNAGAFKAALMEKIAAATPQTLEEADKFKDQNKLDSVKGDLSSQVGDEKKQAANPIEEKTKEQPDTSGIPPKSVTPLPPKQAGKAPSDIGADKAAPKPKSESEVSLQEGSKSLDKQMTDAEVTDRQLAKSNEPQFQTALESKKTAQTHANTAPNAYRQQEQGIVTQAQAQAQTTAQTQLQGMHGEKEQLLTQVVGLQTDTKGQDEQKRSQVANHIQGIYNNTKQRVETALSQLDGEVNQQFDSGTAAAKTQFENYVDQRMKRYKDERYSGLLGWGRWLKDVVMDLPSEVNAFYQEGKNQFLASMGQTIDTIANNVATKLNAAKAEIAKGRQEIQKYVASLDPSLRQVGQEAAQEIGGKFDELEQSVDNKQNELIDSLAQKYNENLQALDTRINEMKAENRGLLNKAMDAMGGVIKTILEMKNLLMGVLSRAAGAIEKIILDPIGFLGNLVGGLRQGFENFQSNIGEHLQKGMVGWLTGTLASTGLQMPESFDMKGIFSLVTQVLGTTYQAIRPRAVKAIGKNGEETVSALESNFEMFVILKNEGVGGLWQFIQGQIGDLKSMVIDTIKSFVIETVIKQGIMWILSLFNPASAFVRACKAIIDIIMFFIERGSQIVELVNAVIESVTAIANGAVGGAAKAIENAMSKALPVVIGFMASLLGLGGITDKIQDIIKRVRQPIEKAIDWVIAQAVKFSKKIGNKFSNSKAGKKLTSVKQSAKDKKVAAEQWISDKKAAAEAKIEQQKSKVANSKLGKKYTAAKERANEKLEALDKKKKAFNENMEKLKNLPGEKLEKLGEKTKGKFKQSKVGQKLSDQKEKAKVKYEKVKEKGKEKVANVVEWWKIDKKFKDKAGNKHRLFFKGKGSTSVLMVASDPKPFEDFINSVKVNENDEASIRAKAEALAIAKQIDSKKQESVKGSNDAETRQNEENKKRELEKLINQLSSYAKTLFGVSEDELPDSNIDFNPTKGEGAVLGKTMNAEVLTKKGDQGSEPTTEKHNIFDKLLKRRDGGRSYYVRGHLLNHHIHGPGQWKNLTPLSQAGNRNHLIAAENKIKAAIESGAIVKYNVEAVYGRSVPIPTQSQLEQNNIDSSQWDNLKEIISAEKYVPNKLKLEAWLLERAANDSYKQKQQIVAGEADNPVETDLAKYDLGESNTKKEKVSITDDDVDKIAANTQISKTDLEVIKQKALSVENLYQYQDIITQIEKDENLTNNKRRRLIRTVETLQKLANVVLKRRETE